MQSLGADQRISSSREVMGSHRRGCTFPLGHNLAQASSVMKSANPDEDAAYVVDGWRHLRSY